jgi:hypothetical protein
VNLRDLLLLYGIVGIACSLAVLRRAPERGLAAFASAAVTIPLWPLWAPFALGTPKPQGPRASKGTATTAVRRIDAALAEAVSAVAGTPMSDVFSQKLASRISTEVVRVAARLEELGALAARPGFDAEASAHHLRDLEARGASERALGTARLQHESILRLEHLRTTDSQALEELAGLLEALRAQLLLTRYAGSSAEGAGAIVGEVWARLEGLGVAFGPVELTDLGNSREDFLAAASTRNT